MTLYAQNIDACFAATIGESGLTDDHLAPFTKRADMALAQLRQAHADRSMPHLNIVEETADIDALRPHAAQFRAECSDVLVLGTGGSSLGGATLCQLTQDSAAPQLHFLANVDPLTFERLFAGLNPASTGIIAISKSGGTAETLAQLLTVLKWRGTANTPVIAISEPGARPLRQLAAHFDFPCLDHDPLLGGRFSVFSTGILPGLIAGIDVDGLRAGACAARDQALSAAAGDSAPALGAAVNCAFMTALNNRQAVLMPYLDQLDRFGKWYRQLWAESLGKKGHGSTPIDALGTVDQHSQLQLYLDGPKDKIFTIITGRHQGYGPIIDITGLTAPLPQDLAYLAGRTMGDLMAAEQQATIDSLIAGGRPVRVISVDRLTADCLGALFMHFTLETIIAADLLAIDAFDQPAVEDAKIRTRAYLTNMD